jgi:hypothetical protein
LLGRRTGGGTGGTAEQIIPLYDVLPQWVYTTARNISLLVLLSLFLILVFNLIRTSFKKIHMMDVFTAIGSSIFMFAGFINSSLLGQRSIQAICLGVSKYHSSGRKRNVILKTALSIIIIIAPTIFTFNLCVNYSLQGYRFVEDESTVRSGYFLEEYSNNTTVIMMVDRGFYPANDITEPGETFYRASPVVIYNPRFNNSFIDFYLYNSKVHNRFQYFGLEPTDYMDHNFTIYDQGDANVFLNH